MRELAFQLYRVRVPMYYAAATILIANMIVLNLALPGPLRATWRVLLFAALAALLCSILVSYVLPRQLASRETTAVAPPVRGRWLGMNSPATKTPSHGVRAYGQTYAIDLVYDPADGARPAFGGPTMRASEEYPAFGEPVFAMLDGTVVRASDWRRDHRARSNLLGFAYFAVEGMLRQLGGPGFIVGNHVTIRSDDGIYAAVAHLQQGSVTVTAGQRVATGTRIGRCGNSGNSTEPHVHAQLMDRASFWTAQGIPLAFTGSTVGEDAAPDDARRRDDMRSDALPADGEHIMSFEA